MRNEHSTDINSGVILDQYSNRKYNSNDKRVFGGSADRLNDSDGSSQHYSLQVLESPIRMWPGFRPSFHVDLHYVHWRVLMRSSLSDSKEQIQRVVGIEQNRSRVEGIDHQIQPLLADCACFQ